MTGRRGGHVIDKARTFPPLNFTAAEMLAMAVSLAGVRQGTRAIRLDRIHAAADTGEPAPHRSYGDLDVDIPDALVRRVDLAG